jgi:hypothetical protein
VDFRELSGLSLYVSAILPDKGISGVGHSVGRFRGSVASVGFWWLLVACPLLGCFGRSGVGESVAVGRVLPYRWRSGLPLSANSQETFRVVLPAYVPASARIPKLLACASASANSQNELVCPSECEFPKRYLTSDGRWGSLVFTASVPSRAQGTQTSLLGARIPVRNWGFYLGQLLT